MIFIDQYHYLTSDSQICVNAEQGSAFAKQVATDYNPIHDADSKRFCVPGDLLFAIALKQYGLHQNMAFQFLDLVSADTPLHYPGLSGAGEATVNNDREKSVLALQCGGEITTEPTKVEQLLRHYVAFSGQNFPHILVPLMQQHNVMINPKRPLVIYESMDFEFEHLDFDNLTIELADTSLEVDGRRGNAKLHFSLQDNGTEIGAGTKNLVLSGLREYAQDSIDQMCAQYAASKEN